MPEAIPPSPYPVLGMYGGGAPPRKTLDGPYVASRPAYQIFADMAEKGTSIDDEIAADRRPGEPVDWDRFNPVKQYGSSGYWFNNGEMEMLPNWPNPANQVKAAAPDAEPAPAPAAPVAPLPIGPAVAPAPRIAPAGATGVAPARPAPSAAPVEPSAAVAKSADAGEPKTVMLSARSTKAKSTRLTERLAGLGYAGEGRATPRAASQAARRNAQTTL